MKNLEKKIEVVFPWVVDTGGGISQRRSETENSLRVRKEMGWSWVKV